jgi:transposase
MKNKYMKRSHISEVKFRALIRLFALDLNGVQIASLTGLSRNTINRVLALARARIADLAERESVFSAGEVEVDESYFGPRRVRGKRGRGASGKTVVFGMKQREGKVYTQVVRNCSAATLVPIIKGVVPGGSVVYSDEWKAYDGLVNVGYKKHYRVRHSGNVFANGRAHVNGIENFWGVAKTRLVKLRGVRPAFFRLHLKETEWRFNHRHENLYLLLLREFRENPLETCLEPYFLPQWTHLPVGRQAGVSIVQPIVSIVVQEKRVAKACQCWL